MGLSDATVSRIVRDRYLLIRRQRHQILPLSAFCVPVTVGGRTPQQIQQLLWELIDAESPTQPYSDEQLARLMKLRFNITIARRTVAKYRQGLGVPAACKRHLRS